MKNIGTSGNGLFSEEETIKDAALGGAVKFRNNLTGKMELDISY